MKMKFYMDIQKNDKKANREWAEKEMLFLNQSISYQPTKDQDRLMVEVDIPDKYFKDMFDVELKLTKAIEEE